MGLAADFKKHVASAFPGCVRPSPGDAAYVAPEAVVVDVMVLLHSFSVRAGEEKPAQRLAETLMYSISEAPHAAMCFDVSNTTPAAKSIEWAIRPAPSTVVTADDVRTALAEDSLPDFASLLASREARSTLCRWIVKRVVELLKWGHTLLVLDDGVPTVYSTSVVGERAVVARPDLLREMHGEADISCIFAAQVLRREWGARTVECVTVDTDLVLIGALNAFEHLLVRLHHFDRVSKMPVYMTVDCWALARDAPARYGVTLMEWAALVASRGTDYVHGGVIKGVGDWDVYLSGCAEALRDVRQQRRGAPIVTSDRVHTDALHATFVAASDRMKRAKLKYEPGDGTLARLAWHVLYMRHAPESGGAGLDCFDFGWRRDSDDKVTLASRAEATYGLGGSVQHSS